MRVCLCVSVSMHTPGFFFLLYHSKNLGGREVQNQGDSILAVSDCKGNLLVPFSYQSGGCHQSLAFVGLYLHQSVPLCVTVASVSLLFI